MLMQNRRLGRSKLVLQEGQATVAINNREVFERPDVVEDYIGGTALRAAERVILDRHRADYVGKRVLDLGVGAGRTAPSLAPSAARYVGVDFSEKMVAACRMRIPEWDFQWGDARDLAVFGTGSFDFVLFFFNGLDYVGDEDRRRILGEVLRVLDRNGVFAFSSHNLEASARSTWLWRGPDDIGPYLLRPRTPAELARALRGAGRTIRNRLRNAGKQIRTDRYAILNDPTHQFGLQTYYISPEAQIDQLRQAGFTGPIDVFGDDGLPLSSSTSKEFLHYVVRKV